MNKDSSNKKHPVPENNVEKFMAMVGTLAGVMGIDDIPEVSHYVDLLGEAAARHVFETHHKISPQKKVHNDRKRFIMIFKRRYQELLDLEYKKVTPVDGKLIHQANKELMKHNFTPDEFLQWVFEEFLVENPHFRPPTIKSVCGQYCLHNFLNEKKELRDAKKRKELDKKAGMDLIQRARGLKRIEGFSKKDNQKISKALKDYGERRIMLSELRKVVEEFEAAYRQK